MKSEQKIVTGGINNTKTPILNPRINFALFELVSTARHIEHCASADVLNNSTPAATTITIKAMCQPRQRIYRYSSTGAGATGGASLY